MDETYDFTLIIERPITDDEIDALFEAGCDDAAPEVDAAFTMLHFARRATTLVAAIASAVVDVESSGLHVGGVGATDLVDLPEIAVRSGGPASPCGCSLRADAVPADFPRCATGSSRGPQFGRGSLDTIRTPSAGPTTRPWRMTGSSLPQITSCELGR